MLHAGGQSRRYAFRLRVCHTLLATVVTSSRVRCLFLVQICHIELKGWFSLIKIHLSCLTSLLRDCNPRVVEAIAWNLSKLLPHLSSRLSSSTVDGASWLPLEILSAIRHCDVTLGANWRPRLVLLELIPKLSQFFTPNQVFAKSAPWLTSIILANVRHLCNTIQPTPALSYSCSCCH